MSRTEIWSCHRRTSSRLRADSAAGAVVRSLDQQGEELGLGIVNYSSAQLKTFKETPPKQTDQSVIDPEAFVCHVELSIPIG
ncbi:hypothetical protein ACNSPU_10010 [Bacillus velezensis]